MNWDEIAGRWIQLGGRLKTNWAKLTDDDIVSCEGKRDRLVAAVQNRYGIMNEEASRQVDDGSGARISHSPRFRSGESGLGPRPNYLTIDRSRRDFAAWDCTQFAGSSLCFSRARSSGQRLSRQAREAHDCGHELARLNRLGDVRLIARLERFGPVCGARVRRQRNRGDSSTARRFALPNAPNQLVAVHLR